jgi:diguanylate cyclase (GGDEF)-like protein
MVLKYRSAYADVREVAASGSLVSHSIHFFVFGSPTVVLAALVGFQELRGRTSDKAPVAAPVSNFEEPPSPISAWQWVAAGGTALAGITHGFVIVEHFRESLLYGLFFTALMLVQVVVSAMVLRRPTTKLVQRVGLASAAVVGLWLLSRTSGLPVGPHPWQPETFGRLDILASLAEAAVVIACAGLLIMRARQHRTWPGRHDNPSTPEPIDRYLSAGLRDFRSAAKSAVSWLPRGRPLPESVWLRRHNAIVRFALIQAIAVGVFGYLRGFAVIVCVADVALVGIPALLALSVHCGRRLRTVAATTSLMLASVAIVDLAGGATEAHFHFFVMVGVVALYQDWTAFGVCFLITVVHHAVMGSIVPQDVYGSASEQHDPILWAFVHGAFILAVSLTHLLAWRNNEVQTLSDPLTQLPNRTAFNERLHRAVGDLSQPVTVLFVDLDHFKNINDSYGHAVGDHALQVAAQRMAGCLRQTDVLARLGGDEFAIVVQGPEAFGPALAARIAASLQIPVAVDGVSVFVRASIGVADTVQAHSRAGEDLLRCADLAMYMAKSSGKNTVVVYDAYMDQAVRERAALAASLRPALANAHFNIHYQPVVTGGDGTLIGVEALLRWQHPTLGTINPATFIPLAEETGDIKAIGLWVLQTACAQMVVWNASRPNSPDLTLAVNVSPVQLGLDDFVESVVSCLAVTGLAPELLILEVTEGLRLYDWRASCERLERLRSLGIKVAIDDFGTGYSSLSYLADLPADIIKIDQSFVRDLHATTGSVFLVNAVMDLAKSLGLDVIAEGVETSEQQAVLTGLGCLHSQGYLHSKPLTAEALTALLKVSAPILA